MAKIWINTIIVSKWQYNNGACVCLLRRWDGGDAGRLRPRWVRSGGFLRGGRGARGRPAQTQGHHGGRSADRRGLVWRSQQRLQPGASDPGAQRPAVRLSRSVRTAGADCRYVSVRLTTALFVTSSHLRCVLKVKFCSRLPRSTAACFSQSCAAEPWRPTPTSPEAGSWRTFLAFCRQNWQWNWVSNKKILITEFILISYNYYNSICFFQGLKYTVLITFCN